MFSAGDILQGLGGLGIVGFLGTVITTLAGRRKANTESASVLTASAISLLEPMRTEMREMEEDLKETKKALKETKEQVVMMRIEFRRLLNELSGYRTLTEGEQQIVDGY